MTQPNPSSPLWPTDWQGCRITAQYLDLAGVPVQGTVTFTATPTAMLDYTNQQIVVPKSFTGTLNVNGVLDITLPATDDPDINPNGWTYLVSENFSGGRKYSIEAPQNSTIDLSRVAPVPAASGIPIVRGPRGAAGGIQAVNGHTEQYITTLSANEVGAPTIAQSQAYADNSSASALANALLKAQNLADLSNAATARTNLGLPALTSAATASTLVLRDSASRFQVADPSAAQDVSTKNYVDLLGPGKYLGDSFLNTTTTMPTNVQPYTSSAQVTFTLARQRRVRVDVFAQFLYSGGGTTNIRYQCSTGIATGSTASSFAFTGPTIMVFIGATLTGGNYASGSGFFSQLLSAGTYTAYFTFLRSNGGSSDQITQQAISVYDVGPN